MVIRQWLLVLLGLLGSGLGMASPLDEARKLDANGRYALAEPLYRQALEQLLKNKGERDSDTGNVLLDLALNQSNQGNFEVADTLLRRAENSLQSSVFESDRARLAMYQSYHFANQGRYDQALAASQMAAGIWRKLLSGQGANKRLGATEDEAPDQSVEQGELAMTLNFQARMALRRGELFTALALGGEALRGLQATEGLPPAWMASVMQTLGEISLVQRRTAAAETYFAKAYDLRRQQFGVGRATVQTLAELGRAYQADGLDTSAIITFRRAFNEARQLRNQQDLFTRQQLVAFGTAVADYSKRLTDPAQKAGLYAEAFDAFQYNRSTVVEQTINKVQNAARLNDSELQKLVQDIALADRELTRAKADRLTEENKPVQERTRGLLEQLISAQEAALQRLTLSEQTLRSRYPDYVAASDPLKLSLEDVRKSLRDDEAMVSFMLGRTESFVQLILRSGSIVARVPVGEDDLADSVKQLRRSLQVQAGTVSEFNVAIASQLHDQLLGGVAEQLKGVTHLVVVPDGPLASLPFGVLVRSAPQSGDYVKADWLGRHVALSHTPSIQAFYQLRTRVRSASFKRTLLAFGDPVLQGGAQRNALRGGSTPTQPPTEVCRAEGPMDPAALLAMPPLPETAVELKAVQKAFGPGQSEVFLRAEATESRLRRMPLSDYRIVYFATHGLLPEELKCQAEPGLVLTPPTSARALSRADDGLLDASEIAALNIRADLVVLSACNTAASGTLGGEALSGLAESFFFSGAKSLLVSHWQVPSGATAALMGGLFAELSQSKGLTPSRALQQSQGRLMNATKTAHPFFWGSFVVVGDGMGVVQQ